MPIAIPTVTHKRHRLCHHCYNQERANSNKKQRQGKGFTHSCFKSNSCSTFHSICSSSAIASTSATVLLNSVIGIVAHSQDLRMIFTSRFQDPRSSILRLLRFDRNHSPLELPKHTHTNIGIYVYIPTTSIVTLKLTLQSTSLPSGRISCGFNCASNVRRSPLLLRLKLSACYTYYCLSLVLLSLSFIGNHHHRLQ